MGAGDAQGVLGGSGGLGGVGWWGGWIEGGPMDEIGLAEESPPESRGEKLPI